MTDTVIEPGSGWVFRGIRGDEDIVYGENSGIKEAFDQLFWMVVVL
jgi:hypothetical protein